MVLDGKSSEEYPVNVGVLQGSIHYADDTSLYCKCHQVSDIWQQVELAAELESALQDTVNWGRN